MNFRRSIVIAKLWRPEVTRRWKNSFLRFFGKNDSLRENFQNSIPTKFIATPIDVLCSNFVKFSRRKIGKVVRYLPDKKFASLSRCCHFADRVQNLPGPVPTMFSECSRFHPSRFTFGGVIPERVNTIKTGRKVNAIFGWSLASSRIIMLLHLII